MDSSVVSKFVPGPLQVRVLPDGLTAGLHSIAFVISGLTPVLQPILPSVGPVFGGGSFVAVNGHGLVETAHILSIAPSAGLLGSTTLVTVTGKNFHSEGASCSFGGSRVVAASWHSSSRIACAAPMVAQARMVSVAVSNFGEHGDADQGVSFRYVAPFAVRGLSPSVGPVGGGTAVQVSTSMKVRTGEGLHCLFGQQSTVALVKSADQIECLSPANMLNGNVSFHLSLAGVRSEDGGWRFEYESSGSVLGMEPRSGPVQGGTDVTIAGLGLRKRSGLYCDFGSTVVVARVRGRSGAVCSSPRHGPSSPA